MRRQAEAEGGVRVLVACEFSGIVRDAFRARGDDAVSCDLLGCERDSAWHITGDVFKAIRLRGPWDVMIAFPPCTHIAVSGARWFKHKLTEQRAALEFMRDLLEADIPKIAIENPIGIFSTYWRKPDQIIQPWQFGHGETKATCLWLKGLPKLVPTNIVQGRTARVHREPPSPDRWKNRSRTYQGIAEAMAEQWSPHEPR
jgi:site-specific DNA-cytosine methylase